MLSIFVAVAGRPCVPSPPSEVSESKPLSPLLRLHTQYMYITAKGLNSIPFQRDIKDLFTFSFFFYCINHAHTLFICGHKQNQMPDRSICNTI